MNTIEPLALRAMMSLFGLSAVIGVGHGQVDGPSDCSSNEE